MKIGAQNRESILDSGQRTTLVRFSRNECVWKQARSNASSPMKLRIEGQGIEAGICFEGAYFLGLVENSK